MNGNAGGKKTDRLRPYRRRTSGNPPSQRPYHDSQAELHLAQLAAVLGGIPDGLVVLDKEWHYTYVNEAAAALLRTTPRQLIGKVVWSTLPEAWRAPLHDELARAVEQKVAVTFEVLQEPRGRWYECRGYPREDGLIVFFTDTTGHKRTEEALRRSEALLAQAGQMASLGAWEIEITNRDDLHANPLHWSEQVYRIFGYEPGAVEVTNDLFFRHVHPGDRPSALDAMTQALAEKRPFEIEHRIIRPDGMERVVREHADLTFDSEGQPLRMIGAVQDITERKRAEEALRGGERRYQKLFEAPLAGTYITRLDGTIVDFNDAMMRMLGYTAREELLRKNSSELYVDPELRKELIGLLQKEGVVPGREALLRRKDGSTLYALGAAALLTDEQTGATYIQGMAIDITDRRRAEEALRESEQRFRAVLENSLDVAYRRDLRNDRYDYISPVVEQTMGFPLEEMNQFAMADVFARIHPEDVERVHKELAEAMASGQGTMEYRFRCKDGAYRWLADYFVVQKDGAGRPLYLSGSVRNITGLKQAEDTLRRSEQRFKSTFENAAVGITHVGLDGRFLRCNSRFCEIIGYACAELTDKTFQEITHPDDLKTEMSRRERLQRGEIARYSIEKRYLRKDGTSLWVNATVSAQRDDEGRIEYFIALVQDISRRKQVEELLRDNEQRLRLALEGAHMGRWEWDVQTDRTFWDERAGELLGVDKRDPATRESLLRYVDRRDRPALEELLQKALTEHEDFQVEFRVIPPGGALLWLALHGRVLRDEQGRAVRIMGVMYDITRRRYLEDDLRRLNDQLEDEVSARTEELRHTIDRLNEEATRRLLAEGRLRQRSRMLEAFFQHTIAPLAFLDKDFHFVRVNDAYARADGKSPEYFVGKNLLALYPDEESRAIFERVVQTKQSYRAYARAFVFPDAPQPGPTYWNWWLTPLLNEAGEVEFLVLNLEDVTERQNAFSELQERTRQLQQLTLELSEAEDRERKRLAEILHDDLQQMLAAAKFHLGLLSNRAKGDEELQEMAGQVKEMLVNAIEKSRSLSRELNPPGLSHSDLHEALEWVAQQMQTKHGLTVHLDARGPMELRSEALKSFVYKAVQEMLFNVIKHAQVKEARLRLRRRHERVYLAVSDKGRGFDPRAAGKNSGFGLLSIRERVRLLGGRMKIKSVRGKGSVFAIAVPDSGPQTAQSGEQKAGDLDSLHAPSSGAEPSPPNRILRVLLADDHKIVRQGLKSMLTDEPDIDVVGEAGNGREAVDLTCELQPDVVVMDVSMPVMAGDEATRQIKLYLPRTRVIALSMHDDTRVADRMRKVGAAAYLLKTAPSEDLLTAIRGT